MLKILDKKLGLYLLAGIAFYFIIAQHLGHHLFDNNWSFYHFDSIPTWYFFLWISVFISSIVIFFNYQKSFGRFIDGKLNARVAGVALFLLFIIFRYDSFVFGDGNLRINQIGITENIFIRWFEFGSIWTVKIIYEIINFVGSYFDNFNQPTVYRLKLFAAANAWIVFSYISIILAAISAFKITHELSPDHSRRWLIFVILFFGPQSLLYFGYTGLEPVIVAFIYWFALFAIKLSYRFTTNRLMMLWLIQLLAIFFHISLVILIPASIYISIKSLIKWKFRRKLAITFAMAAYLIMIVVTYILSRENFEFSKYILFLSGKNPHSDYGLFSLRHLGDIFQAFGFLFPQFIVIFYLLIGKDKFRNIKGMGVSIIIAIPALTLFFIADPINGMPFDIPRFTALLTPLSLVLVLAVRDVDFCIKGIPIFTRSLAALCMFVPLSYIPVYTNIHLADKYLSKFLDNNEVYFLSGSISFRDSYFYKNNFDKANYWEWEQPKKSPDYINFAGCTNLVGNEQYSDAFKTLNLIIAQHPYWVGPRSLLASTQLLTNNPQLAKPNIDTCLLLEPFEKEHHRQLFLYYQSIKNYPDAFNVVENSLELYPSDTGFLIDLMVLHNTIGNIPSADSLANKIIQIDPDIAYPYAIKAFIAERTKNIKSAIGFYEEFIRLAPDDPETPSIRKRLNNLILKQKEQ